MPIAYTDFQVTTIHAAKIDALAITGMPAARVMKRIPGVGSELDDGRIGPGIYLQPIGSTLGRAFSSVQDKGRGSIILFAMGSSTNQAESEPDILRWREEIVDLFNRKRITGLAGEKYTMTNSEPVDLDKDLARRLDVVTLTVVSWFREDRR